MPVWANIFDKPLGKQYFVEHMSMECILTFVKQSISLYGLTATNMDPVYVCDLFGVVVVVELRNILRTKIG